MTKKTSINCCGYDECLGCQEEIADLEAERDRLKAVVEFVVSQELTYVECAQGEEIVRRCKEALKSND